MFVLCPHCQFLVALLANGLPPGRCPRCDGSLQPEPQAVVQPTGDGRAEEAVADAGTAHASAGDAGADSGTGDPAAAEGAMHEPPVAPGVAADDTAIASDSRPQGDVDGLVRVADPDMLGEAMRGPAAIEVEIAGATASDAHAAHSADTHRPAAPTATGEAAAVEAAHLEAAAVEPAPAQSGPPHAPAAETVADVHAPDAAAGVPPAAVAVPGRKARNTARPALPSFARAAPVAKPIDRRRFWLESAAIAALSLLLAVQWLLADRARLAGDAGWRPLLSTLCGVFGCDLPAWREPLAFTLVERDVRPHPQRAGALRVTATFRNDARWPQPWPGLLLTLSDIDGRVAGARVFTAREYLGAAPTQNQLDSGQSATVAIDVLEPTPRIVAFTFDFR